MQSTISEFKNEKNNEVEVFADKREKQLIFLLNERNARVVEKQLDVGDFIVSDRIIIERKTSSDFESSIVDGRLFEQAARLKSYEKPILIVEGYWPARIAKKAYLGAIAAIVLDFGIQIIFSSGCEETADLIYIIAKREQFDENRPIRLLAKKKAYSLEHQKLRVLEAFPSIGPKSAKVLLEKFKSLKAIFKANEKELSKIIGKSKAAKIKYLISST